MQWANTITEYINVTEFYNEMEIPFQKAEIKDLKRLWWTTKNAKTHNLILNYITIEHVNPQQVIRDGWEIDR